MTDIALPPEESVKAREPVTHAYDNPQLIAKQFLLAIMRDPTVPIRARIDAANKLLRIVYIDGDYVPGEWCNKEPSLTIKIRWDQCPMIHSADMKRHASSPRPPGHGSYRKSQSSSREGPVNSGPH